MQAISLLELQNKIKNSIDIAFQDTYWIVAEINQLSANYSGHAYLELIEKNPRTNKITAKIRATIWASTYSMLKPYFESTTGNSFKEGIKILVSVTVTFHKIYGLSLNILDIDPVYTLGDLEKQKKETITQLKLDGVFEMNKEIEILDTAQKIAIISSKTAAGYGDFVNQLENNDSGFKFYCQLFPATMQGDKAEDSIIATLDKIYGYGTFFDVVIIIRGGGSKTDLSCFDSYQLALNICQFSIPIITGIGHQRDETIADLVANTSLKTPTAVADFLISNLQNFENILKEKSSRLNELISFKLNEQKIIINNKSLYFNQLISKLLSRKNNELEKTKAVLLSVTNVYIKDKKNDILLNESRLKQISSNILKNEFAKIDIMSINIKHSLTQYFSQQKHFLEVTSNTIKLRNPKNILKKGYSITTQNGKLIKNSEQIIKGEIIETELFNGNIKTILIDN